MGDIDSRTQIGSESATEGRILYDAERVNDPSPRLFKPGWWADRNLVEGHHAGRGSVLVVRHGDERWVLRHYRRGGLPARINADGYVWLGLERTRPWREFRLLAALRALKLPVPAPVAASVQRHGLLYRGDLITVSLDHTHPLAERLQQAPLATDDWRRLGGLIRRFHRAGVHHPDLNARNILCGDDGGFWLLDFDGGRLRAPAALQATELPRLRRSLHKIAARAPAWHGTEAGWQALEQGYRGAA